MIANLVSMGKVLLNPFSFISSLFFHFLHADGLNANPNFDNVVGTLLQACSGARKLNCGGAYYSLEHDV